MFVWPCPTSVQLVYDALKATLKGDGVGRALERQAKLALLHAPVVEDGVDLVVHQPPLHRTLQHGLDTQGGGVTALTTRGHAS